MKLVPGPLACIGLALAWPPTIDACGRCRGHHRRVVIVPACAPIAPAPAAIPAPAVAMPMLPAAAPVESAPAAAPAVAGPVGVQPSYDYAAATNGQPAYYYTYDSSGKLIVAQWMDWVFRGGRAAGEPAPPLPIIGNLRNR